MAIPTTKKIPIPCDESCEHCQGDLCDPMPEHTVPAQLDVCERCQGTGVHDPEGFSDGFTSEDFAQDPDFAEDYFAGRYDVQCSECKGNRVATYVNWDECEKMFPALARRYWDWQQGLAEIQAEYDAERRMGA